MYILIYEVKAEVNLTKKPSKSGYSADGPLSSFDSNACNLVQIITSAQDTSGKKHAVSKPCQIDLFVGGNLVSLYFTATHSRKINLIEHFLSPERHQIAVLCDDEIYDPSSV